MTQVHWLGLQPLSAMEASVDDSVKAREERILLFEPRPVFRYSHIHDLGFLRVPALEFAQYCKRSGIEMVHTHDGGGLMYHGPGQLVLYASLDMPSEFQPVILRNILQKTMMRFLERYGVRSYTNQTVYGSQGVWVEDEGELRKIGFLGARFSLRTNGDKMVSRGCAINLAPDLTPFTYIHPCNLPNVHVSSVERITGIRPTIGAAPARDFADTFAQCMRSEAHLDLKLKYSDS